MKFYTTIEVAEMLKINRKTVISLITHGSLKATRVFRRYRVSREDFQEYVRKHIVK